MRIGVTLTNIEVKIYNARYAINMLFELKNIKLVLFICIELNNTKIKCADIATCF